MPWEIAGTSWRWRSVCRFANARWQRGLQSRRVRGGRLQWDCYLVVLWCSLFRYGCVCVALHREEFGLHLCKFTFQFLEVAVLKAIGLLGFLVGILVEFGFFALRFGYLEPGVQLSSSEAIPCNLPSDDAR